MPSGEELDMEQKASEAHKKEAEFIKSESDSRTVNNTMRHEYRVLSEGEKAQMVQIKNIGLLFDKLLTTLGSKREYSIAKTKIEEAVMWAVKGLTQ